MKKKKKTKKAIKSKITKKLKRTKASIKVKTDPKIIDRMY